MTRLVSKKEGEKMKLTTKPEQKKQDYLIEEERSELENFKKWFQDERVAYELMELIKCLHIEDLHELRQKVDVLKLRQK